MRSIFIKEVNSFFSSIVGYAAILLFLVGSGLFVWIIPDTSVLQYGYASLDRFFEMAPLLLLLLIPAVTMRTMAEEYKGGTIEWLSTKPLSDLDIIVGKYLACLLLVIVALIPTGVYIISISSLSVVAGNIDTGGIAGSYIGLLCLAATFTAVGVFCSSLTSNQVVGFMASLAGCWLLFTGFGALSKIAAFGGGIDYYLNLIGMSYHYDSVSRGVIDSRDVIYFISLIILFIALTRISLGNRTADNATRPE
jgi:ABC-2 type transport system permease protein